MARTAPPAILLVTIGAAAGKGEPALLDFAGKVAASFPAYPIAWAFTTAHTGKTPLFRGMPGLSVAGALSRLAAENHTRIAVQPLHLVAGLEYAALCRHVETWRHGHPETTVAVGDPLLTDAASMHAALDAMRLAAPPFSGRAADPEEAPVWVGHGSEPPHNAAYHQLAALAEKQTPRQYVGCLVGGLCADGVIASLTADGKKRVCLMPLFTLAGHHAARDLAGDEPGSWKSQLNDAGLACRFHPRGLLEHDAFAALWIGRLREALHAC